MSITQDEPQRIVRRFRAPNGRIVEEEVLLLSPAAWLQLLSDSDEPASWLANRVGSLVVASRLLF